MNSTVSELWLCSFSQFIANQMGLYFPKERWCDLERELASVAKAFNFTNVESCIQWLMSSALTKNQIEVLASHLTVGETYFFREQASFEALKYEVFPELITYCQKVGKKLTIWSAGCCSGEEPYSLAILLNEMIPNLSSDNVSIIATDINPHFLHKASKGVYSDWSFRNTPSWLKERYFEKNKEGRFNISPKIKRLVVFAHLNLVDTFSITGLVPNFVDLVFCRNVLMYFALEQAKKVVENIYSFLSNGGWLIVSPSELSNTLFSQFTTINYTNAILYRKINRDYQKAEISFCKPELKLEADLLPILTTQIEPEPLTLETKENIIEETKLKPNTEILYLKALSLYEQGLYETAIENLLELLLLDQNNIQIIVLLAKAYNNQGKHNKAIEWCQKAIAINKLDASCYYLLASIFQEQNQIEEAIKSLKKAIYIDQNFIMAYFALGTISLQQINHKESNKYFENALSLLSTYKQEEILPYSEAITAGRLIEIIKVMSSRTYHNNL